MSSWRHSLLHININASKTLACLPVFGGLEENTFVCVLTLTVPISH